MRQRKETFFRDKAGVATARSSAGRAPTCKCGRWGTRKLRPEKAAANRRTPKPLRAKPARGAPGKRPRTREFALRSTLAGLETGAYKCGARARLALIRVGGVKPAYRRQAAPTKNRWRLGAGRSLARTAIVAFPGSKSEMQGGQGRFRGVPICGWGRYARKARPRRAW
jgi:hypothetical protein